jgi:glycosyltransferase involved in cell wall biosynthesis
MPRKKLLILIEWFAPGFKAGGPIRSCVNLCLALSQQYHIFVLTTDTDHGSTSPYTGIPPNQWIHDSNTGAQVYYADKKKLSFRTITHVIQEVNPDFIYLNLFFSPHFAVFPLWQSIAGKLNAKIILCPRGTLYDSAISLKWYLKKPFLLLLRSLGLHRRILFHATNQREAASIKAYFPKSSIVIADNLPNTLQQPFIDSIKKPGELRCIFVARLVPIKNLLFLLQLLEGIHHQMSLTIVGPIEDQKYWSACQAAIDSLPQNITVNYAGPKQESEIASLLHQHHLFILPTTGENFGHAIFESLLAGRPVLISDQTPWLDLHEHNAGWALPLTDKQSFLDIINQIASGDQQCFDLHARAAWNYAHQFINKPGLTENYQLLFN